MIPDEMDNWERKGGIRASIETECGLSEERQGQGRVRQARQAGKDE